VVVSIIALLVGILLPAIAKSRSQAKSTLSQANLRNLSTAHHRYAADYGDRQFSLIVENLSSYGSNPGEAIQAYRSRNGIDHPDIYLGWTMIHETGQYYNVPLGSPGNAMYVPITFTPANGTGGERFGSFRLSNVQAFNRYVGGKFYDPTFYAPQSQVVMNFLEDAFESPLEYRLKRYQDNHIAWTSYCLSPAAMFSPDVMRNDEAGGWQDPWDLGAAFRTPSFDQCLYPNLKTHVLEHHWLQNRNDVSCNPGFAGGTYGGCEPYYFNHAWESSPNTAFFDGHIESVGVRKAMRADGRLRVQTANPNWGLWSRDTAWGDDGYFIQYGYDQADSSFHIFTTDGIRGRDYMAE